MSALTALRTSARWTGTPAFLAAATAGGLAVAAAVDVGARSPRPVVLAVGALALVLASIQRPTLGLFVLVALTFAHGFIVIKESAGVPSAALPFALVLVVIASFAGDRRGPFLPAEAEPAVAAFAAYGAWLVASSAWAEDPDLTLRTAAAYGKLMLMVLAVLVLVRSPIRLAVALWGVAGAAGTLAAMTVAQRFAPDLTFYGFAKTPVHELTTTGEVERAVGPIGNPNAYAQILVIAVPIALGLLLSERRLALRLLAAAAAGLAVAAISLTFSRGGFVGLAVVLVLSLVRYRSRLAVLAVGATVVVLAVGVVSGSYGSRLETLTQALPWHADAKSNDPSVRGRAAFLKAGTRMWRDHPVGGVGFANYAVRYPEYNRRIGSPAKLGNTPHDAPLEVLAETGLVGLALWVVLMVAAFTSLWRVRTRAAGRRPDVRITADFLGISLVGYLVTALFIAESASRMLAWLLLALCFSVGGALGSLLGRPVRTLRGRASPSAR